MNLFDMQELKCPKCGCIDKNNFFDACNTDLCVGCVSKIYGIGKKVVMVNCPEADRHKGHIWEIRTDPWTVCGSVVVALKSRAGGFDISFLKPYEEGEKHGV